MSTRRILQDTRAIGQVLGCLIQKPDILSETHKYNLNKDDFPERFHKIIFACINNLYNNNVKEVDSIVIDNFLSQFEVQYNIYNDNNGLEYIEKIVEISNIQNFKLNYDRVKKFSLLRDYEKNGIDVSDIYDLNEFEPKKLEEMQQKFDKYSIKDIIEMIDKKLIDIKEKYLATYGAHGQQAGEKMKELIEELKKSPAMGAPLSSKVFTAIVRGARLKKLYMRSAPTGVGRICPLI